MANRAIQDLQDIALPDDGDRFLPNLRLDCDNARQQVDRRKHLHPDDNVVLPLHVDAEELDDAVTAFNVVAVAPLDRHERWDA